MPTWMLDESYVAIVEIAKKFWPNSIAEDFTEAVWAWRAMPLEDKLTATANLREKQATEPGSGRFSAKNFAKYMSSTEWRRGCGAAQARDGPGKVDPALALAIAQKKRKQELNHGNH